MTELPNKVGINWSSVSYAHSLLQEAVSRAKQQLKSAMMMNLESKAIVFEDIGRLVSELLQAILLRAALRWSCFGDYGVGHLRLSLFVLRPGESYYRSNYYYAFSLKCSPLIKSLQLWSMECLECLEIASSGYTQTTPSAESDVIQCGIIPSGKCWDITRNTLQKSCVRK